MADFEEEEFEFEFEEEESDFEFEFEESEGEFEEEESEGEFEEEEEGEFEGELEEELEGEVEEEVEGEVEGELEEELEGEFEEELEGEFEEEEEEFEETFLYSDEEELEGEFEEEEEFEETFLYSDAKYAAKPQGVTMASIIPSQMSDKVASSSSETKQETSMGPADSIQITTEASESSLTFCEICVQRKEGEQMFSIDGCIHSFCTDCISKHVAAKIQDGISNVTCLGLNCKSVLELETCRPVLSKGVLDLWEETLCNTLIASSQKCYCPFNDCSAMLLNDNKKVIRETECPFCHRLFCVQCNVPWHSGVECEEYQRLNEDERGRADLMLRELAKEKKWSRCPQCKFYVERTDGCPHITCR